MQDINQPQSVFQQPQSYELGPHGPPLSVEDYQESEENKGDTGKSIFEAPLQTPRRLDAEECEKAKRTG
jgi:hypothetical protein